MNKLLNCLFYALCAFVLMFAMTAKAIAADAVGVSSLTFAAPGHDPLVVFAIAIAVIAILVFLGWRYHARIFADVIEAKADVIADYRNLVSHLHAARTAAVSDANAVKTAATADIDKVKADADAAVAKAKADVAAAEAKVKAAV